MAGRKKKHHVLLTADDRKLLKSLIRKKTTSLTICRRCQVLLALDENHGTSPTYRQCAAQMGVSPSMVYQLAKNYALNGLQSVLVLKRSPNSDNARRKLDGRAEARIIKLACSPAPDGRTRWTMRLLAERSKVELEVPVSKDTICRALKKTS